MSLQLRYSTHRRNAIRQNLRTRFRKKIAYVVIFLKNWFFGKSIVRETRFPKSCYQKICFRKNPLRKPRSVGAVFEMYRRCVVWYISGSAAAAAVVSLRRAPPVECHVYPETPASPLRSCADNVIQARSEAASRQSSPKPWVVGGVWILREDAVWKLPKSSVQRHCYTADRCPRTRSYPALVMSGRQQSPLRSLHAS